jgi:hypothetical protein
MLPTDQEGEPRLAALPKAVDLAATLIPNPKRRRKRIKKRRRRKRNPRSQVVRNRRQFR